MRIRRGCQHNNVATAAGQRHPKASTVVIVTGAAAAAVGAAAAIDGILLSDFERPKTRTFIVFIFVYGVTARKPWYREEELNKR